MDHLDRDELAAYLRRCRSRVQPADVGLESGLRRRTPGLRRQEVAQLAGMSVDYYVRLEQARGPRPSRSILAALARALRLSDDERSYLYNIAGEQLAPSGPSRDVRPGLLHLLDRLDDAAAVVCDAKYDVLAWNPLAAALMTDFSAIPEPERNIAWRFFAGEGRDRHDEQGGRRFARECVADLRAASARYPSDPGIRSLVRRLSAVSPQFCELWALREVDVRHSATKRLHHPAVGWIELDCEALFDPDRGQWVVFHTARTGTPSYEALRLLKVVGTQSFRPGCSADTLLLVDPANGRLTS